MNSPRMGLPRDPELRKSADALRRAALRAREIARQTGTDIVINQGGKVLHVSPDDLDTIGLARKTSSRKSSKT